MQIVLHERKVTNATLVKGLLLGLPQYLKDLHADPWGRNYALYRGEGGIAIVSAGPDRDLCSPDDVLHVVPNP
ncbi:MAG TPA: hypothetical protein VMK66_00125 [Myxococcales bacterium]|nr:hypothetical protein [Myxococcales bacterium]